MEEKNIEELSKNEMEELSRKYYEEYMRGHTPWVKDLSVGRNEPCPCGSGKKFKKCCMDKIAITYNNEELKRVKYEK